jgi:hypothetical protein
LAPVGESPSIIQSQQIDMGVQASPMTSLGNDSSELADSYDSEAILMFKPETAEELIVPEKELDQEDLESGSYMIQNSVSSSRSDS